MLYRKWRPQTFDELVGQGHVVRTLRNALRGDRVAHAYLFAGPRGTGKTTCARLLAKAVNCLEPEDRRPCNECAVCQAISEGRFLDLIEIDAASNTGVDDVRELQERVGFQPAQGRFKVYVIDEIHMLSNAAFNALLKTLEEPPPRVIFVLATTEPHKLPATVVSRCQRFAFHPISERDIVAHLERVSEAEGIEVEPEALILVARHARGALRDALSLLEQVAGDERVTVEHVQTVLGLVPEDALMDLAETLARQDAGAVLGAVAALLAEGARPAIVQEQLVAELRRVLAVATGTRVDASPRIARLAEVGVTRLVNWMAVLVDGKPGRADDRIALELALVKAAIGAAAGWSLASALEERSVSGQAELGGRTKLRGLGAGSRPDAAGVGRIEKDPAAGKDQTEAVEEETAPAIPRQIEALREHWDDVLREVRRAGDASLEALLRSCNPVAVTAQEVVVAAQYEFHRSRLESDDARRVVEQALETLLGGQVVLQIALAQEAPSGSDGDGEADGMGEADDDVLALKLPLELAEDLVVRTAVQEMGATARLL
jgi:DNA polymerase-3 subunit gamma/tau